MSFIHPLASLQRYAEVSCRIERVTVPVTENYARRVLRVKKREPLKFGHLLLRCIGSKRWRERQP
jgi:hypothetical protein